MCSSDLASDSFDIVDPISHSEKDVIEGEGTGETETDNFEVVPGTEPVEPTHEQQQNEVVE